MKNNNGKFDIIVIGAGHAGCEAALASARLGHRTLLLTLNLEAIAFLACNPSIGGTAKGQIVSEIDALGGEMGIIADSTSIQFKMLGTGKGPAVQSLRAQSDKRRYHSRMKYALENQENLILKQAEAKEILTTDGAVSGVSTTHGETFLCRAVIVCTGVYLGSRIIIGEYSENTGPAGFAGAKFLTESLLKHGIEIQRFKTGTPARLNSRSVNFSLLEPQYGNTEARFSYLSGSAQNPDIPCFLAYTNENTHKIIRENLHRAPMYSGNIHGTGARYCPSIEDKIVRFADKERHQLFLEPEGEGTNEIYLQGLSTSLPVDVQEKVVHSIAGLENAEILRYAYAIEYDCINPDQLTPALEVKKIGGLFTAGQINGTSGYEEAAAQGLVAGINASRKLNALPPFILRRDESYIGVLIDDIINKGTKEPYRMMTSRAEHRLHLRQDNADFRLTPRGREAGLVSDERWERFLGKQADIQSAETELDQTLKVDEKLIELLCAREENPPRGGGITVRELLRRPNISGADLRPLGIFEDLQDSILSILETNIKYEGYLKKQESEIAAAKKAEQTLLPNDIDYSAIGGLRIEARQKLNKIRPVSLGQASRISGVSPADISVLIVYLAGRSGK